MKTYAVLEEKLISISEKTNEDALLIVLCSSEYAAKEIAKVCNTMRTEHEKTRIKFNVWHIDRLPSNFKI